MPSETFVSNIQQSFQYHSNQSRIGTECFFESSRIATEAICKQIYISRWNEENEDIEKSQSEIK